MPYLRAIRYRLVKWGRSVIRSNDSPKQIAGGVAIGVFSACNPTVISQGFMALVVATLCRCSRIPAVAMTFLSNPFTAVPIYGSGYMIGAFIVQLFGFKTLAWRQVHQLFTKPEDLGFRRAVSEKLSELASVGWAGVVPMEVGATVLGLLLGLAAYYFALRFVTGHRLLKAQRMALRAKRRLERVRLQQTLDRSTATGESRHG